MNYQQQCLAALKDRGVQLDDLIDLVILLQKEYMPYVNNNTLYKEIKQDIEEILSKREVYHVVMTGIALDIATEKNQLFNDDLAGAISEDYGLYGVDEVLAYGICNLYGSIALTNFGYVDKLKPGIIGQVNNDKTHCNTFLDDIIGAIVASAASKLAHTHRQKMYLQQVKEGK